MNVPTLDLSQIYFTNPNHAEHRTSKLVQRFKDKFNCEPTLLARSPGRVNIIGEHIDYSGFPVLPMALEYDVIIASCLSLDGYTRVCNIDPRFLDGVLDISIAPICHDWTSYVIGAFTAVKCKENYWMMVDGSVPTGAGLSSSAALTCAAVLSIAPKPISKSNLVSYSLAAEHSVGLHCGEMDQTISVYGQQGSACLVRFNPRCIENIAIPNAVFVVANTLIVADKIVSADTCYNLRLVETKVATAILAKMLGLNTCNLLADVSTQLGGIDQAIAAVDKIFHKNTYNLEEAAAELDMTVDELCKRYAESLCSRPCTLQLHDRALHVFKESQRVNSFVNLCQEISEKNILAELGELMNQSQSSCRDLFDCSCKELDELTALCRLTGAGWGGCTVSLVSEDKAWQLVKALTENYYTDARLAKAGKTREDLDGIVFLSKPGVGSALLE